MEGADGPVSRGLEVLQRRGLDATGISITISDPRRRGNPLLWVNRAFTETTGYAFADAVGRNCSFLQGPDTDQREVARIRAAIAAEESVTVTLLNHRADGTPFWNRLSIDPVLDGEQLVGFVGVQTDVTAEIVAGAERDAARAASEAALARETAARISLQSAHRRLQLMAAATTTLSASLDPETVVGHLADLCVPQLADWLFVAETDETGTVVRVTTRHHAPAGHEAALQQVVRAYEGRPLPVTAPAAQAIEGGNTVTLSDLHPDGLASYARGLPDDVFAQLGTRALAAVPLAAADSTWGAMVLVRATPHAFPAGDLEVAEDLGRRAGQALANARTYTREATLAESLQRALLPGLPDLPDVTAAAHYTSAVVGAAVGGDLYDLMDLPGDAVGIVVADVAGHDVGAAATMGTLRDLVRAQSWAEPAPDPAQVLAGVDRLMQVLHVPTLVTAVVLQAVRPTAAQPGWTVRHANAGHPPVLLRLPDGGVDVLDAHHDVLLGVDPALPRTTVTRVVPAGSQLVLYTDGLVEQPGPGGGPVRDLDEGTQRLVDRLTALPVDATPQQVVDDLRQLVVERLDDTAVLVVQLGSGTLSG
ncbi:PAS domain S-box-containing protein [Klenkia marina]|uniref:PAS domain S-box-containing protein n=1 Tax=Klenkia marina TaxID=1960309 RepID=A0A1G4Z245_9ACTN|nr:SpoIIE family protein phosphatase [Klenkia marina]SCX59757.1 PAS domain S-box-containing protein [Klenkia marina]